MRSRSSRSTGRARRRRPGPPAVVAYLLPAVVGGGTGDVAEVLAAGWALARAGVPLRLYRRGGRPLPRGVVGPWGWPPIRRVRRLRPSRSAAITVTPAWGISGAPAGPPPLGGPGPWSEEVADIEAAHGADRTVHVSLEEFARTLSIAEEERERFREGGVTARAIPSRRRAARARGESAAFAAAFRRFRAFDRPNVLHLYATFERRRSFARAFPAAIQTAPLGSGRPARHRPRGARAPRWVWYASPASAAAIAGPVAGALARADPPRRLWIRSPHPWTGRPPAPNTTVVTAPLSEAAWRRRWSGAEVRIATGSRSLLEALEDGGPFLYFNGVLAGGVRRRRHRPEKIVALLGAAARAGWPSDVRTDLADFARGRRVAAVVGRVAAGAGGWGRPRAPLRPHGFRPPFDDPARLLTGIARALAAPGASSRAVVAHLRARSNA